MATPQPEETPKSTIGPIRQLRNYFFTGVIVALPIGVTLWLIFLFVGFVDDRVKPLIPDVWNPETYLPFAIPGLGLLVAVVAVTFLGVLAANFFGRFLLRVGEDILERVPIVRNIYHAIKQIVTTIAAQRENAFKDVCLVEYPRKGVFAIGFVTSSLKGAPYEKLGDGHVCVFVPTTPNPTSGFLLIMRTEDIQILDMTPEEGAKMIISGGMVTSNTDLIDPDED